MASEQTWQTAEAQRLMQATGGPSSGPAAMEQMIQFTEESNRRILDDSLAYLSPQQMDALRAQQHIELAGTRAMLRMQRPSAAAVEQAAPPPGR
jgi:hypothetical protein